MLKFVSDIRAAAWVIVQKMTDQRNKKKICWKSKLQAVCTLKATCSISLVRTIHQASTCKVCRWVVGIWTINIVLILFIHIILKNKNKNKKQIRLHAPSSRFSQTHASLASSLQTHAFLKFAVPGSTLGIIFFQVCLSI